MYKAFPCSDYYGGSVAMSTIARWFRQSPFSKRNNYLARLTIGCDFHSFAIYYSYAMTCSLPKCSRSTLRCRGMTCIVVFRHCFLSCHRIIVQPIKLHPCVSLSSLQFSRHLTTNGLTALPTCYFPLWVSPPSKSVGSKSYHHFWCWNTDLISCHRDIYYATFTGAQENRNMSRIW